MIRLVREPAFWLVALIGGGGAMILGSGGSGYLVAFQGPPHMQYEISALPSPRLAASDAGRAAGADSDGNAVLATQDARELNPVARLKPDELGAIQTKPLFSPSRAPHRAEQPLAEDESELPDPTPIELGEPAAAVPSMNLVGIMVMGGVQEIALLRDNQSGRVQRLSNGDMHEGWVVEVIDERSVAFVRDGERHVMTLFVEPLGSGRLQAEAPTSGANADAAASDPEQAVDEAPDSKAASSFDGGPEMQAGGQPASPERMDPQVGTSNESAPPEATHQPPPSSLPEGLNPGNQSGPGGFGSPEDI